MWDNFSIPISLKNCREVVTQAANSLQEICLVWKGHFSCSREENVYYYVKKTERKT